MINQNPYDELPYRCFPIEWTAPERLALASILHSGPKPPLHAYRVLELGCGNGANLIPMAFYRRHGYFVGIDGARTQIDVANHNRVALNLSNIEFIHSDFTGAASHLGEPFDYIIAHGVFSWVSPETRDALLELCARYLLPEGLLYLNYNTRPGWTVRDMVREFLFAQTNGTTDLRKRAQQAQEVSALLSAAMREKENPYSHLLAGEFQFVCEIDITYIAHEYLSTWNTAYWRSEFLALARASGFEYIGDADFSYSTGRMEEPRVLEIHKGPITGRSREDTIDFLCYRQLHSPILTRSPWTAKPLSLHKFMKLRVASGLLLVTRDSKQGYVFQHPSGYQVAVKDEKMATGLRSLRPIWPRSLPIEQVFADVSKAKDDLILLHRHGLLELRCIEPGDFPGGPALLPFLTDSIADRVTTPYHTQGLIDSSS